MNGEQSKLDVLASMLECIRQHSWHTHRLQQQMSKSTWEERSWYRRSNNEAIINIIKDWRTTKDEFRQKVKNALAYWEGRQDIGPITHARLEKIVSLWEAMPNITSIVKQVEDTIMKDEEAADLVVEPKRRKELEDYHRQVDNVCEGMRVLTFWEKLYRDVKTAGHYVEVAIKATPDELSVAEWGAVDDARRKLFGLRPYLIYKMMINDVGVGTCDDFTFDEERRAICEGDIHRMTGDEAMWDCLIGVEQDNKAAIKVQNTLKEIKPMIYNLLSDLEKAGRPTFPVKGANPELRSGGGGGGGGKAAEIIRNATTIQRAMRGKKGRKAAAEAKAEAEAEVRQSSPAAREGAGEGAAEAAVGIPDAAEKAKAEAAKDSQAAEGEGEDDKAGIAAHITRQREKDGLLPRQGSDNEKQLQTRGKATKR